MAQLAKNHRPGGHNPAGRWPLSMPRPQNLWVELRIDQFWTLAIYDERTHTPFAFGLLHFALVARMVRLLWKRVFNDLSTPQSQTAATVS